MYIPSYDFRIFDLPQFSPLSAQEFGADTMFSAATPTSFIDYSINQLSGLFNSNSPFPYVQRQFPSVINNFEVETFFQGGVSQTRERLQQIRDKADDLLRQSGGGAANQSGGCTEGRNILGGCGPIFGSKKVMKSDGNTSGVGTTTPTGGRIGEATTEWFKSLPQGAGVFIIAIVVIILLLLFVKK
jgi:hypothetical protein